ncbi:putative uncharacterized protein [Waddlia chondrophila 2032/99]|nr:hypothetical protein [Waddlia chondrophila]CCB90606.1 putative uncharacterized protein [Waddlia chondrophila 2032/99]
MMTKKILMFAALGIAMLSVKGLSADDRYVRHLDANGNGIYEEGEVDPCREYRSGPMRCTYPVTKFKKKTYCTKRCVKEPYTVRKKCVRYKPEYYTKTYCRQVPETYYTCETRYRDRWVTDERCCYEPYTYYKTECINNPPADEGCPSDGCPTGGCPINNRSAAHYNHATQSQSDETPISNAQTRKSRHY